jgi:hypothetical protein
MSYVFVLLVLGVLSTSTTQATIAAPHVKLETVCNEATELVNGYSMGDVCKAMFEAQVAHRNSSGSGPSLGQIFPSAAEAAARMVTSSAVSVQRTLQQEVEAQAIGGLAFQYAVSYLPGIGCALLAYNGVIDLFSIENYVIATTRAANSPKPDMFTCKFTTRDITPVPPGARANLASKNLLFPGSFAAIVPRLRCQFTIYTPVDKDSPVSPGNPSQGFYGSTTL